jgi:hypothetical protein
LNKNRTFCFWCDDLRTPKIDAHDWQVCRSVEAFEHFFSQHFTRQVTVTQMRLTLALDNDAGVTKGNVVRQEFRMILGLLFEKYNIVPSTIYILTSNEPAKEWIISWCKTVEKIYNINEIDVRDRLSHYVNEAFLILSYIKLRKFYIR